MEDSGAGASQKWLGSTIRRNEMVFEQRTEISGRWVTGIRETFSQRTDSDGEISVLFHLPTKINEKLSRSIKNLFNLTSIT